MKNEKSFIPQAINEPIKTYLENSSERKLLETELQRQLQEKVDIPLLIGGKAIRTGKTIPVICPHDHSMQLASAHLAGEAEIELAIQAALMAREQWENMPFLQRAAVFLKAAELISQKYRYILNAATMLNQSKNYFQAEIDASGELADFFRFNCQYAESIYHMQPVSGGTSWNQLEYRPLEGFVLAISPFNFTAIAGNLTMAPAIMGNTVFWKPASTALLSGYYLMQLLLEAGLPEGVINFVPCQSKFIKQLVLSHPKLAGVHFTGSTEVFNDIWRTVGENLHIYQSYPRVVGETGGKNYILMHHSADSQQTCTALIRSAFEYQGQKCSACSRAYIPQSRWPEVKNQLLSTAESIQTGDVCNFNTFCNAVIDEYSFDQIITVFDQIKANTDAEILCGGNGDKSKGYFIRPTVIQVKSLDHFSLKQEFFAPILSIYVYEDDQLDAIVRHIEEKSYYALTGAIFASDRLLINELMKKLKYSAGNFYINDKCSGAMVGQQPFGGARGSGTNDKAGSHLNLIRWVSPRTIKENFYPDNKWQYPAMKSSQ
jgi:1-pyrroline-5-carboxylate dehydrogenase